MIFPLGIPSQKWLKYVLCPLKGKVAVVSEGLALASLSDHEQQSLTAREWRQISWLSRWSWSVTRHAADDQVDVSMCGLGLVVDLMPHSVVRDSVSWQHRDM